MGFFVGACPQHHKHSTVNVIHNQVKFSHKCVAASVVDLAVWAAPYTLNMIRGEIYDYDRTAELIMKYTVERTNPWQTYLISCRKCMWVRQVRSLEID